MECDKYPVQYREKVIKELYEAVWAHEACLGAGLTAKAVYDATMNKGELLEAMHCVSEELNVPDFKIHKINTKFVDSPWFPKAPSDMDTLRDAYDMSPDDEK